MLVSNYTLWVAAAVSRPDEESATSVVILTASIVTPAVETSWAIPNPACKPKRSPSYKMPIEVA